MSLQHLQRMPLIVARRVPFYYGWIMLVATVMGTFALYPGQTVGISAFNVYFLKDLQLGQTELSGAYMLATLIAGVTAMFAGAAMDRFGLRCTITISVILLSGACMVASQVVGLWSLFIAFMCLRIFGHGILPLLTSNTLAMWFHGRLGFATGVAGMAGSGITAIVPIAYLSLIQSFGWRMAWVVLALVVCATMLPIMAFVFCNRPQDVGQRIDGILEHDCDAIADRLDIKNSDTKVVSFNLIEAFHTRAYWIMLALGAGHGMIFAAIMFHRIQLFEASNLTVEHAAVMVAVFSVFLAAAQLIAGVAADRVPLHILLFASTVCVATALATLALHDGLTLPYMFGAVFGAATGVEIVGRNTMWPRYFGRKHLGKIKGSAAMATVIGSSIGPFIVGATYDVKGRYEPAVWFLAGVYAMIAVALLFAKAPRSAGH